MMESSGNRLHGAVPRHAVAALPPLHFARDEGAAPESKPERIGERDGPQLGPGRAGADPAGPGARAAKCNINRRITRRGEQGQSVTGVLPASTQPSTATGRLKVTAEKAYPAGRTTRMVRSQRSPCCDKLAEGPLIDGGIDYNVRQHGPLTAAARQLPEPIVVGQLVGDGAEAADGLQRVAPQRDRRAEGEGARAEERRHAHRRNEPIVDEERPQQATRAPGRGTPR